jgi:XTP/dITP diphosphohydrolase
VIIDKLVIASHNPGKVVEIRELLGTYVTEIISAGSLGLPEPEETGKTFVANAELKARASAQGSGLPSLADDSGLAVDALDGAPGIYSARWAGPEKDFALAMQKIERLMGANPNRRAQFICALSLAWPQNDKEAGRIVTVEGIVHGTIVTPPRGRHGFGYDPMFVLDGYTETFGEMEPAAKHAMSHRADAFRKLVAKVFA